jgi:hypothetical protein
VPSTDYSNNFLLFAAENNKNLLIAISIKGLSTILTSGDIYTRVRYGDPNLVYGEPGVVYGGLRLYGDYKPILQFDGSSLTLQQKIEPEQGRASVTMINLSFNDQGGFMTKLISPGILIPDILGAEVELRVGFPEISYPEDYALTFRGVVSQVTSTAGTVNLQISDPNARRRQQTFFCAKTKLKHPITSNQTSITVNNAADLFVPQLGPDGTYDPAITTYVKIGSEIIQYPPTGIDVNTGILSGITRGARATTPAAANQGADVSAALQVEDHIIDMALKIMLSGSGQFLTNQGIAAFVNFNDASVPNNYNAFQLAGNKNAVLDLGIAPGDYITITGAANAQNNGVCRVVLFLSTQNGYNQVIVTDKIFVVEGVGNAVFSVRSQYDTYPADNVGLAMPGYEVDVDRHQYIKNTFLSSLENSCRFYIDSTESSAKTFIENELYLPFGCYSLTRFGRMSVQLTHAPLADQRLQVLDKNNVVNPQNITPMRGVNSRKFFNEIDFNYDEDDTGTFRSAFRDIDSNSLNIIGLSSTLPITSKGIKSDLTTTASIQRTANNLLSRYKNGAVLITLETNFGTGIEIEAGDVVVLKDDGFLQISNFSDGTKNLGAQLFEVVDRRLVLTTARTSLQLVSGLGASISDRYATIAPASELLAGSNSTLLKLTNSFGSQFPGQEHVKWDDYLGLRGLVHTQDWGIAATCIMESFSSTNPNDMIVSGLSFSPSAGCILEVDRYPLSTDPTDQQIIKQIHCFCDASVTATSGISDTQFMVDAADIDKFVLGLPVSVHNDDYSIISVEQNVSNIDTGTNIVTVAGSLGFAPSAGNVAELIGFPDGGGPYRFL